MNVERYQRIKCIFGEACAVEPAGRDRFLDDTCGDDTELRREVVALLANDGDTPSIGPVINAAGALRAAAGIGSTSDGSSAAALRPPRAASLPEQIGEYRIAREVGHGGMGVVYEAEQPHPRRRVALKVIRPGCTSPQSLRRFQLETHALATLQHPGIAQIFESGITRYATASGESVEQPFFAMEYITGRSLADVLEDRKLGTRARLELVARICDAVHHAHQKGVVHRDLKPANVLVDATGQPKILDFGVARVTTGDEISATLATDAGQLIGTMAYMSPEQASGHSRDVDTRADVYSLGVILYESLSGRLPYDVRGKSIPDAARAIVECEPAPLGSANRTLRGDLETITSKALEKDRERRYASAADLAADLRRYLNDEPIAARPASIAYQLRKLAKRNRVAVVGAVAVVLSLLVGTVVSTTQMLRALGAERLANQQLNLKETALAAAEQSRQEAQNEAGKAQAVQRFLVDMFAAVDPSVMQGYDTALLRALLDETSARLEHEFLEQPDVRAALQDAIGAVYASIGRRDEAEHHLVAAYETDLQRLGARHPDTLAAQSHLAELRWDQGKLDEAEALYSAAIEALTETVGQSDPRTLLARYSLAGVARAQGRLAESERELAETAERIEQTLGPDSPLTLRVQFGMAMLLRDRGELERAGEILQSVLASWKATRGERHPSTYAVMRNLALVLQDAGRLGEADVMLSDAIRVAAELFDQRHPELIQLSINQAGLRLTQGRFAEAETIAGRALELSRGVNGERHVDTLKALTNLALALRNQNKLAEAEAAYAQAVELAEALYGPEHPDRLNLMNSYAGLLYRQRKLDEATVVLREVVDGRTALLGAEHIDTLSSLNNLGLLLIDRGDDEGANVLFADLVDRVDRAAPPNHWFRWVVRNSWARTFMNLGRPDEAEPILLEARQGLERTLGIAHMHTRDVLQNLAELYDGAGRAADAARCREMLNAPPE